MATKLKNGMVVGEKQRTALSVLLGFNTSDGIKDSLQKLDNIVRDFPSDVTVIGDVSMVRSNNGSSIWHNVIKNTPFAAATVPVYQAFEKSGSIDKNKLLDLICEQAECGVSIITIHPTASHDFHELSKKRIIPCTSRGGAMVYSDMCKSKRHSNIYISELDAITSIARKNGVIISIGTTYRTGTIVDAFDILYQKELDEQIRLANYLESRGVQTIIETPGHADARSIELICQKLSKVSVPIMPLGPMPTDVAFDYDDLAACIGAVLMGVKGKADILTVVTREEHLGGIPSMAALHEAICKYRVAAHIIDLKKINNSCYDREVSYKRKMMGTCAIESQNQCQRCSDACPLRSDFIMHN